MRHCNNCNQQVEPKKNVSVIGLVILLLLFIIPGIIYLIYCLVQKGKCPMCNGQNWGNMPSSGNVRITSASQPKSSTFCGGCGTALAPNVSFCQKCGKQQPK